MMIISQIEKLLNNYYTLFLTLLCAVFLFVGISSVRDDAVTIDEVAHIVSGYSMVTDLKIILNIEHPPLMKVIAAAPLLFQDIHFKLPLGTLPNQWIEGHNFLFENRNDVDAILLWSRMAVLFFHTVLLFFCGVLLRKFMSSFYALGAVFLLAFEPNILAHSRYVTTYTGIALFTVITLLLVALLVREPSRKYMYLLGLGLGGALLTKFSGVLLALYVLFIAGLGGMWIYKTDKEVWKGVLKYTAGAFFIALCLVYSSYTILNINTPSAQIRSYINASLVPAPIKQFEDMFAENIFTKAFPSFVSGFDYASNRSVQKSEETGAQFLDGEIRLKGEGWWYYFLKAFLYKESPAILLLTAIAACVGGWMFWQRKKGEMVVCILMGFSLLYLVLSLFSSLNIGIRHISPVLALTPIIGVMILSLWEWKYKNILLLLLLFIQFVTVVSSYPFYLSYFNDLSGGSLHGNKHLSDSNVDWGQNMKRLSKWAEEKGLETLYVDYWGKTPLNYYDPKGILKPWNGDMGKPQGVFAVYSVWIEQSKWMKNQGIVANDYSYLEKLPLYDQIGNSIFIYDLR